MTPMRTRKRARMTVHMQPADDFSSILRMAIVAFDTLRHVHSDGKERRRTNERKKERVKCGAVGHSRLSGWGGGSVPGLCGLHLVIQVGDEVDLFVHFVACRQIRIAHIQ
jgi:hypothetical protein